MVTITYKSGAQSMKKNHSLKVDGVNEVFVWFCIAVCWDALNAIFEYWWFAWKSYFGSFHPKIWKIRVSSLNIWPVYRFNVVNSQNYRQNSCNLVNVRRDLKRKKWVVSSDRCVVRDMQNFEPRRMISKL